VKTMSPEKRIYVIVPRFVKTNDNTKLEMSCGRIMAQVCHVVSKLKLRLKCNPDESFTTVVLAVEDDIELGWIEDKLIEYGKNRNQFTYESFFDDGEDFYGDKFKYLTGLAMFLTKKQGKSLFYNLTPWRCSVKSE